MPTYHLAQINIARAVAPLDDPRLSGFVTQLEEVNARADVSAGFIWRLQTDEGDATSLVVFDDPQVVINMSVWKDIDSLRAYVYEGRHLSVLKDKARWFEKLSRATLALWWVPAGHTPTVEEGLAALARLDSEGPGPWAFSFAQPFAAPAEERVATG